MANEYLEQAQKFLKDADAKISITYIGTALNKDWGDTKPRRKYRWTITTPRGTTNGVFYDSLYNKEKYDAGDTTAVPNEYDVLAALSADYNEIDSFEDFCAEYGYDPYVESDTGRVVKNQRAQNIYNAVQRETASLKRIFTPEQIDALREIN